MATMARQQGAERGGGGREKEKEGGEEGKGDGLSFCYTVQATIHLSRHSLTAQKTQSLKLISFHFCIKSELDWCF